MNPDRHQAWQTMVLNTFGVALYHGALGHAMLGKQVATDFNFWVYDEPRE
jgi:hypothetical protein